MFRSQQTEYKGYISTFEDSNYLISKYFKFLNIGTQNKAAASNVISLTTDTIKTK